MRRSFLLTLGTLACLALTAPASAQFGAGGAPQSRSGGFFIEGNVSGNSTKIKFESDDSDFDSEDDGTGGGLGLRLGYGFTPAIAIYAGLNAATIQVDGEDGEDDAEYGLATIDLGAQYSFANPARKLVPFLTLGLSAVAASNDEDGTDTALSGGGLTLGGGVRYHFTPALGLTAGLEGYGGTFTKLEVDDDEVDLDDLGIDIGFTGGRFRLGLTWFPGR